MPSIQDTNKLLNKWGKSVETANQQFEKMAGIAERLNNAFERMVTIFEKMYKQLQSNAKQLDSEDLAAKRLKYIQEQWKKMTDSIKEHLKQLGSEIRQTKFKTLYSRFSSMISSLPKRFNSLLRALHPSNIWRPFAKLRDLPSKLVASFKTSLRNLPSNVFKLFRNTVRGFAAVWKHAFKPLFMIQKNRLTGAATPLRNAASQVFSTQNLKSAMAFSDNYMNSLARISAVNDGTQSNEELQAKILAAANRSRGQYFEMTEHVAKLGLTAPKSFSSNDEMIAFAELSQKAFRLGGAGAAEQQAGMEQLIHAMGSGGLQGDDFKTIMNTAPMLADAIADFTGKSIEELIAMSAEGQITADIIKGALFTAADEINGKFEKLPKTFGDLKNQLSNQAIAAFGPVIERVNEFMNSPEGQQLVAGINQAIHVAAALIGNLINGITALISFVTDNWSTIEPILMAIGTVWLGIIIAQLWSMVPPLVAQAAAWLAINWPILLIAAVIALVIYALIRLGKTAEEIVGTIFGVFAFLGAAIWNTIVGVINGIIQFLWTSFVEPFIGIFEWFFNFLNGGFDNFGQAVKNLFGQIISWALSILKVVTKVTDAIFGNDWTGHLEKLQDDFESWGKNEDAVTFSKEAPTIGKTMDPRKAWDAGYRTGEKLVSSIRNGLDGFNLDQMMKKFGAEDGMGGESTIPGGGGSAATLDKINKVNEVGRIGDTVDISSEDLKMMRELAELNAIQNFVTLTPTVNVQTGDIRNGYDVDTIIARIEQSLTEQIASSAQGVYGLA